MSFKSQKELLEEILKGTKIRLYNWDRYSYIHLQNESLVNEAGVPMPVWFNSFKNWRIYEPPKEKKTITLYRYGYILIDPRNEETTASFDKYKDRTRELVYTESRETEITLKGTNT